MTSVDSDQPVQPSFKLRNFEWCLVSSFSEGSVFPDYLEVAIAVVVLHGVGKLLPVHRYSVDIFSYAGPSGILGSDRKQNTA